MPPETGTGVQRNSAAQSHRPTKPEPPVTITRVRSIRAQPVTIARAMSDAWSVFMTVGARGGPEKFARGAGVWMT